MSLARPRGAQLHQAIKRSEWLQGFTAYTGVDTLLPIILMDRPQSRQAVRCFLGTVAGGQGKLVVLGIDFDVNIISRTVTWLATARWPLGPANVLNFDYWSQGITS